MSRCHARLGALALHLGSTASETPSSFRSGALSAAVSCLVLTACEASTGDVGTASVTTIDAVEVLAPTREVIGDPYVRVIRSDGVMLVCSMADSSYEVTVIKGDEVASGDCAAFPMERLHREGSFPYSDATINGNDYRANEVHVALRGGSWLLFLEGGHDESVIDELFGAVFQIVGEEEPRLVPICSGHIRAADVDPECLCIREVLDSLDFALVRWLEDDTCTLDYSFCPTA